MFSLKRGWLPTTKSARTWDGYLEGAKGGSVSRVESTPDTYIHYVNQVLHGPSVSGALGRAFR